MTEYLPLFLKPQADRRIRKGHLWIYSNEVDTQRSPMNTFISGQMVQVLSSSGKPLGVAFINPNALLCGRLLSRDARTRIDQRFIEERLRRALALREQFFRTPHYRLVYGDADFLPGIIVDRYGDYLVVQIAVAGFDLLQDALLEALRKVVQPKGMVVRNDHQAREMENLDSQVTLHGEIPEFLPVEENGCRFDVPAVEGQKTGWFYDHRVNRAALQNWVASRRVLDVFCYLGGWGVQAAVAGAQTVLCVDSSQSALEGVTRNAGLNGVADKVAVSRGRAVDVLKSLCEQREKFDVVILDPPAFIKRRKDQKNGEAAYYHINELAVRLLEPDGLLASASCSMPLQAETLTEIVRSAARHCDRDTQMIYRGGQGPDHPVHPAIPETDYLKAQFFRVMTSH